MDWLAREIKTWHGGDRLSADTANGTHWDHTVDLLIVGSGAGAMTTAICAHDRGGRPLLIEKTALYGGSSAMSGPTMRTLPAPCR